MNESFKPDSYCLSTGKWVPNYIVSTVSRDKETEQFFSFDKQFDSKDDADEFVIKFFEKEGYILDGDKYTDPF